MNYVNERIENTILILSEGVKCTADAYDTNENFSSEIKQYLDNLLAFKKKNCAIHLNEEIKFKRQE